jgi:hypothetical protein
MFIIPFRSRRIGELLSLMFTGRDSHTADAEYQRQQRRNIYVVYGPPCDRYARFVMLMPAMFRASAAEVQ